MTITFEKPPEPGWDYTELFSALKQNPGNWVRPNVEEICGSGLRQKRANLYAHSAKHGVKIHAVIRAGALYVQVKEEEDNA